MADKSREIKNSPSELQGDPDTVLDASDPGVITEDDLGTEEEIDRGNMQFDTRDAKRLFKVFRLDDINKIEPTLNNFELGTIIDYQLSTPDYRVVVLIVRYQR